MRENTRSGQQESLQKHLPTYSSWLNQMERWFAMLADGGLKRSVHRCTRELEAAIGELIGQHNEDAKPFI